MYLLLVVFTLVLIFPIFYFSSIDFTTNFAPQQKQKNLEGVSGNQDHCDNFMKKMNYLSSEDALQWLKKSRYLLPRTHLIGDSTIRQKMEWIAPYKNQINWYPALSTVWLADCPQMIKGINHIKNSTMEADAVIWNIGLHSLHAYPLWTSRSIIHKNTKSYSNTLKQCADYVNLKYPNAKKFFKLSNKICDSKMSDFFKTAVSPWNKNSTRELEDLYYLRFDSVGTEILNYEAMMLVYYNHSILPSFTHGACDCTPDGRHYTDLDAHFLVNFVKAYHNYSDSIFIPPI